MSHGPSPIWPVLSDGELDPRSRRVFAEIRAVRGEERVNDIWRVLANDPDQLERTWAEVRDVLAPGALDPLTKQLIYVAVSVAHGCEYCTRSHLAATRGLGAEEAQIAELYQVIGLAAKTNRLAAGLAVPVDEVFR